MSLLPLKFASADAVPEGLRDYFKAGDNGEMIVEGFDGTPPGWAPVAKLDEFRETNRRLMTEAKKFEGIDPAKARADAAELAVLKEAGVKPGEDILESPRVKAHVARLTEESKNKDLGIAERDEKIKDGENRLLSRVRDDEARRLGIEFSVKKGASDDIVRRVREVFSEFDDKGNLVAKGPDGTPLLGKDGKPLAMREYVEGLRETSSYYFEASSGGGASASGARGAGAKKDLKRQPDGSVNLTWLETEVKRDDPTWYKQIMDSGEHLSVLKKAA